MYLRFNFSLPERDRSISMAPYLRRGTLSLAARVVLRPQKQHVSLVGSTNRSFVSSTQSSSNLLRTSLVRPNFSSRTDNGGEQSYFALQAQFGRRAYSVGKETEQHAFWEHLSYWGDASKEDFLKHQWQASPSRSMLCTNSAELVLRRRNPSINPIWRIS